MIIGKFFDVMYDGDIELLWKDLKALGMFSILALPVVTIIWPMFNMS